MCVFGCGDCVSLSHQTYRGYLLGLSASLYSYVSIISLSSSRCMLLDLSLIVIRVVELNAGIICSCMPVLPILLKRVAKSESYRKSSSVLRYLRIRRTATESSEEKMSGSGESNAFQKIQIAVPKPTMTGLRTFIRGGNRSQLQPNVRNESFAQLDSVDDYHHALRQHI